jgi:hypothetical protein
VQNDLKKKADKMGKIKAQSKVGKTCIRVPSYRYNCRNKERTVWLLAPRILKDTEHNMYIKAKENNTIFVHRHGHIFRQVSVFFSFSYCIFSLLVYGAWGIFQNNMNCESIKAR